MKLKELKEDYNYKYADVIVFVDKDGVEMDNYRENDDAEVKFHFNKEYPCILEVQILED